MNPLVQDLGVGVGLRPAHHFHFLNEKPKSVHWIEVISENYMPWKGKVFGGSFTKSIDTLLKVRRDYPVALHGVSMNLGSVDSLDLEYMKRLKQLVDQVNPFVVSDHLSWTGVNGQNLHDLLPVPYSEEALRVISKKVEQAQDLLGRRLLIENPSSYLEFKSSEISEPEFILALLRTTDCGLLLDINNVYVSSVNHGFDPISYLKQIPKERVGQIHLAGHSKVDCYLIDTHDEPVCEDVWNLYKWAVAYFGTRSVMIERDGNIPEWSELEKELLRIGEIHEHVKKSL
jgi:uncharacterized protein (UPF0276 family)